MANGIKQQLDGSGSSARLSAVAEDRSHRAAWSQLGAALIALALLTQALPSPIPGAGTTFASGSGDVVRQGGGSGVLAQTALLSVVAGAVWALLLWGLAVAVVAGVAGLPGRCGRYGRVWLARIAPVAARRLVITAVGASLITGVAGCSQSGSAGIGTTPGADGGQESVAASTAATPTASFEPGPASWDGRGFGRAARAESTSVMSLRRPSAAVSGGPLTQAVRLAARALPADPGAGPTGRPTGDGGGGPASGSASGVDLDWPTTASAGPTARPTALPTVRPTALPTVRPTARPTAGSTDRSADRPAGSVIVRTGDTLWSIAAGHLPSGASAVDIDAAWRTWYSANRTLIGANPDVIQPGQQLVRPQSGDMP